VEHGYYTAQLGKRLEEWLVDRNLPNLKIYYDHGREGMNKVVPFFRPYSRATTLAFVDCTVVDTVRKKALVLCEVEERGASPKKIIGDICNLLLAEALCIGGEEYSFDGVPVILGVCVQEGGQSGNKVKAIGRRIETMVKPGWLRGLDIRIVPKTNREALVESLFGEIRDIVVSYIPNVSTSNTRAAPDRPCRPRTGSRRTRP